MLAVVSLIPLLFLPGKCKSTDLFLGPLTEMNRDIRTGATYSTCSSHQDLGWEVAQANAACVE